MNLEMSWLQEAFYKCEIKFIFLMAKLIYGKNPVLNALLENRVLKVYLKEGFNDARILKTITSTRTNVRYVSNNELVRLSHVENHQGIVADVQAFEYSSLDEIIHRSLKSEQPLILLLDEISDPHNFGAIIRSADAFNVDGIIIKDRNQVEVNSTVYKVSTGAIEHVKIAKVSNLSNAIKVLKKNGFWIYSAAGEGADDYNKQNYDGKNAIIVGNEGVGISKLVRENSDFIIKIPMMGHVNSLNVSVATGILLSRIRNK